MEDWIKVRFITHGVSFCFKGRVYVIGGIRKSGKKCVVKEKGCICDDTLSWEMAQLKHDLKIDMEYGVCKP